MSRWGGLVRFWEFAGGILWAPRATIRRVLVGEGPGLGWLLVHAVLLTAAVRPTGFGQALLVGRTSPLGGLQMVLRLVTGRFALLWIGVVAIGVAAALVVRLRRSDVDVQAVVDAAALCVVPTMVLATAGVLLRTVGLEISALPHRTLSGGIDGVLLRAVVGYGWTVLLWGLVWKASWRLSSDRSSSSPALDDVRSTS